MSIPEIQSDISAIESNAALYLESNFNERANAIDFIDFHIIHRIMGLQENAGYGDGANILRQRAEQIKYTLEQIDVSLFKQLRENIQTGIYTKSSFSEMICKYFGYDAGNINQPDEVGYDNLDIFINGLLSHDAVPEPATVQGAEMVYYQKTPARVVCQMAALAQLNPDDVFFDIGSGLGQVSILVNLTSGARAVGIEYEPAYCDYAITCALQLNLPGVEFFNTDARTADYSRGTVFFLYTPFEGSVLQDMLQILQKESQKRDIRIFTYGPCSPQVTRENWLKCQNGNGDDFYKLYEFTKT